MSALEDIGPGAMVRGVVPGQPVQVVSVDWIGNQAINLVYRGPDGGVSETTLWRDDEPRLGIDERGRTWSFDGDGGLLRLVTEASRIELAYHFDPYLAIHTSRVDPLPHQISAVYGEMLPRQPLRFLLADDPGAGKTIMAGLLIKELIARGDLERCLIVAPGSLVEQWQDELGEKFGLEFDILTREMLESSRSGNPFEDRDRLIARLDMLARNEALQEKLGQATEWSYPVSVDSLGLSSPALRWATAGGRKVFSPAPFWGMEVKRHNAPLSALCTPCKVCMLPPIKRSPKIRTAYSVPLPADHQALEVSISPLPAAALTGDRSAAHAKHRDARGCAERVYAGRICQQSPEFSCPPCCQRALPNILSIASGVGGFSRLARHVWSIPRPGKKFMPSVSQILSQECERVICRPAEPA